MFIEFNEKIVCENSISQIEMICLEEEKWTIILQLNYIKNNPVGLEESYASFHEAFERFNRLKVLLHVK